MKPNKWSVNPDSAEHSEYEDSLRDKLEQYEISTSKTPEGFRIHGIYDTPLSLPPVKVKSLEHRRRARRYKTRLSVALPKIESTQKPHNEQNNYRNEQDRSKSYDKLSYSVRLNSAIRPAPSCTPYTLPPKYGCKPYIKRQDKARSHPTININTNNRTVAYNIDRSGNINDSISDKLPPIGSPLYNHRDQLRRGGRLPLTTKGSMLQPKEVSHKRGSEDSDLDSDLLIDHPILGRNPGPLIGRPGQRHLIHVGLVRKSVASPSPTALSDLRLPYKDSEC